MNEMDVREEIIAPLIRQLGYRTGTENNVLREVPLRYPFIFLGRKSGKKDVTIRGIADYILEAGQLVRWVIEAKPPTEISTDDVEQAFSYANHAEVRAVYFALCNGKKFILFQTNQGPTASPILTITYQEFSSDKGLISLKSLLAPQSILRDHPRSIPDIWPPIGPGLRSFGRISGGHIAYEQTRPSIEVLEHMQISVIGGSVQRDPDGTMIALVESRAPIRLIDEFIRENGLSVFEMSSSSTSLSTDPLHPTIFNCKMSTIFPAGETLINVQTWEPVTIISNMHMEVDFQAAVVLDGETLYGKVHFISQSDGRFLVEAFGSLRLHIS
jgi:hypothetical protein